MPQKRNAAGDPVNDEGLPIAEDPWKGSATKDILGYSGVGLLYGALLAGPVLYIVGLLPFLHWWLLGWGEVLIAIIVGALVTVIAVGGVAAFEAIKPDNEKGRGG